MGQPHLSLMPPPGSSECPVQSGSASGTVPPGRNPSRTGPQTEGRGTAAFYPAHHPPQNSTPFRAGIPFSNGCLMHRISVI